MSGEPFPDRERVDARDKVRGATMYAADHAFPRLLYAMTVPAPIAKGRITALETEGALRVPGVVRVLTPADFPAPAKRGPDGPSTPRPTLENQISFRGQPIALVVAETLEAAIQAAEAIRASIAPEPFAAVMDSPGAKRQAAEDVVTGNAAQAMANAATIVEGEYMSPAQHHNPIELISTTAVWEGGRLTIYEGSQNSGGIKTNVALALGLDPAIVDVKSPTVGGGFGQKGWVQRQTALVARAAMLTGRPVKLVMPRGQVFHVATFRPSSRHRIRLGADAAGKMIAVEYHAEHQQSPAGTFLAAGYHDSPIRSYNIENYRGTAADLRIDTQPPGHMRAPHPQAACFAFESAVDELANRLGQDPVAFRIAHDTRVDQRTGRPLSSRFLNECLREGAARFGWARRTPAPRSMVAADGALIGWGVAAGVYPSMSTPAIATLRVSADGRTRFAVSGHEMGQGIRTALTAVLLRELRIDAKRLDIAIGDTSAAPQHRTVGSWGTASAVPIAVEAAARMRSAIADLLAGRRVAGNLHQQLAAVRRPFVQIEVSRLGLGQNEAAFDELRRGGTAVAGPAYPNFTTMSYSAHFVEVRVEPRTARVRMPRVVSMVDCGRVISPRTAASQVRGAVIWAFGAALREATDVDPRYGGFLNNDLADYVVPVNAEIGEINVGLIDRPDPMVNALGLKGVGEVAMVGASAAIANAIFHATGKRVRTLPIRIEHLL